MTQSRNTKRALLASMFSLVLCFTMLIGSTFAWFTDSATTGVNKITAGNLDVKLEYSEDFSEWNDAEKKDDLFAADKWEPGYTKVVYFKVSNAGSLAFNYKVTTNIENEQQGTNQEGNKFNLSEYLQFGIVEVAKTFSNRTEAREAIASPVNFGGISTGKAMLTAGTSQTFAMVVWMPEEIGNIANHDGKGIPEINFGINVIATQATVESDSFDNQYDKDADEEDTTEPETATVVTAAELQAMLTQFTDAESGNKTINIAKDIILAEGETWTPVTVDGYNGADIITINGNGHSISGLTAPLFSGGFAGGSGIVINELTIKDSTIVSENTQGSGAFIETVDSMDIITLNDCHLSGSTVKGSRTGGLIGWTSGYNNQNDGAVKTYVTVKDCSVINCTIENTFSDEGSTPHTESTGAIFGHAGANAWTFTTIENCTITNNSIIGGNGKTGVILGTANIGEVTITDCTMEGNKVNGSASDAVYGRTAFGTTGKLTIDGTAIQ